MQTEKQGDIVWSKRHYSQYFVFKIVKEKDNREPVVVAKR
jgi:hypothetical protein